MAQGPVMLNENANHNRQGSRGLVIIDPHKTILLDHAAAQSLRSLKFDHRHNNEDITDSVNLTEESFDPRLSIKTTSALRPKLILYTTDYHSINLGPKVRSQYSSLGTSLTKTAFPNHHYHHRPNQLSSST